MSRGGAPAFADQSALSLLLQEPRYEVIPVQGIEQKVAALPYGATVTVTASPTLGLDRTLDVSTALAARGFRVVPHFAARMVTGRGHLERLVQRLEGTEHPRGVRRSAATPTRRRASYADAGDLLEELAGLAHPFVAHRHRRATRRATRWSRDDRLLEALLPQAAVRQSRRHAALLRRRRPGRVGGRHPRRRRRPAGGRRPARRGGAAQARRDLAASTGVGASLRYLRKHGRQIVTLARSRRYDPTPLAEAVAEHAADGRSASAACTSSPSTRWSRRGTGWRGPPRRSAARLAAAAGPASGRRRPGRQLVLGRLGSAACRSDGVGGEHRPHQDQRHADGDAAA